MAIDDHDLAVVAQVDATLEGTQKRIAYGQTRGHRRWYRRSYRRNALAPCGVAMSGIARCAALFAAAQTARHSSTSFNRQLLRRPTWAGTTPEQFNCVRLFKLEHCPAV
jgi:hypothetical protein